VRESMKKIVDDSNKVEASPSNKKAELKKNNSKVSQIQTLDFQTFIKYKDCVTSKITERIDMLIAHSCSQN